MTKHVEITCDGCGEEIRASRWLSVQSVDHPERALGIPTPLTNLDFHDTRCLTLDALRYLENPYIWPPEAIQKVKEAGR
jgi:hypothetical protein